jgi:hypothetical protein
MEDVLPLHAFGWFVDQHHWLAHRCGLTRRARSSPPAHWELPTSTNDSRPAFALWFRIGLQSRYHPAGILRFLQTGLAAFMPYKYTVLAFVVIGAFLIFVGAAWGPETNDVDFALPGRVRFA